MYIYIIGEDASQEFDDARHTNDAKELMKQYCIGDVCDNASTS